MPRTREEALCMLLKVDPSVEEFMALRTTDESYIKYLEIINDKIDTVVKNSDDKLKVIDATRDLCTFVYPTGITSSKFLNAP